MQTDLDEAERIGSSEEMNLLVETSHQPEGGSVVRLKLEKDLTEGLTSPVVGDLGKDYNMASAESLANSITWAMKEYPSKYFMVVLADHGAGWMGANMSESHNSWMSIANIQRGFKKAEEQTGRKPDVIGFDECLMASTEVAHQISDCAGYMVASEEVEGGAGWQYDDVLGKTANKESRIISSNFLGRTAAALRSREALTPAAMVTAIVEMAEGHQGDLGTMAAIDLTRVSGLTNALDGFAGAVLDSGLTRADFRSVKKGAQKFDQYADMGHFVELAGQKFGGKIGEAADMVKKALEEAVIAEQHGSNYPNARGLNIEFSRSLGSGGLSESELSNVVEQMTIAMSPQQLSELNDRMPEIVSLNAAAHRLLRREEESQSEPVILNQGTRPTDGDERFESVVAAMAAGEGLGEKELAELVATLIEDMTPQQLRRLYFRMPDIISANAAAHGQSNGDESRVVLDSRVLSEIAGGSQYSIPGVSKEGMTRIAVSPYESLGLSQDTRWDEMLEKVC